MILCLSVPISTYAQGSIYGSVISSDASTPANGELIFFGFLNNTDNEIRAEVSFGAGYDAGNWYDDFQNFIDESPGIPYTYRFFNIVNGEGTILDGAVPSNSFHREDIVLGSLSWPSFPTGFAGQAVSSSSIVLTWDVEPGVTSHVYRRFTSAEGSFFRIDEPSGALANPGISVGYFYDFITDGVNVYDYVLISEDDAGNLGPHGDIITVNASDVLAPEITTVEPEIGPDSGGTAVIIFGTGFDMTGVSAFIGENELHDVTIVSPFEITGSTPTGEVGSADVRIVNLASGLSSNILSNAFTYTGNLPPILHQIDDQGAWVFELLSFEITATDPDGDDVMLTTENLPPGASFIDNGWDEIHQKYTGTFSWTPTGAQLGAWDSVRFVAADSEDSTDEYITITVTDGNYSCGDVNDDGEVNLLDILYLISYVYVDPPGPAPDPLQSGDVNGGDGAVNLLDILHLISFIYGNPPGPGPDCP